MGRSTELQIPWEHFDEETIHQILEIFFYNEGYDVQNLHKADRAREGGADLVVEKVGTSKAIAVKMKPLKKDAYQLIELSRRDEDEKIYVHINTPTGAFREEMEKRTDVIFWDKNKLTETFCDNNLYFASNLILGQHSIFTTLEEVKELLFVLLAEARDTEEKPDFDTLDRESFQLLWRLKDMAVTLHQSNTAIKSIFETLTSNPGTDFEKELLNSFESYMDWLEKKISRFNLFLARFYKTNQELLICSIMENEVRSHWLHIASFVNSRDNATFRDGLEESLEERKRIDEIFKENGEKSSSEEDTSFDYDLDPIVASVRDQARTFVRFGWAIESFVDDVIEEYGGRFETFEEFVDDVDDSDYLEI